MTLKELELGNTAVVTVVGGEGSLRQHFLDMGVIPGAEVTLVKYAPMGDPMELRIHGYELTLRLADAARIEVEPVKASGSSEAGDLEGTAEGKETVSQTDNRKRNGKNRINGKEKRAHRQEHPGLARVENIM